MALPAYPLPVPNLSNPPSGEAGLKTLVDRLLEEQQTLTPVEAFAAWHERTPALAPHYRKLMPGRRPESGEQYAFEVNVSACTGCKACVSACHSLNGLDEHETWRDVGMLLGGTRRSPVQQIVTTACHHCGDPACANGCPVLAYEKDAETGIVRHLDDQCIGCQYCILKCPYDVPKYSPARGIVRKCDMCTSRLAEGEAPACVQACPNEAIRIITVPRPGPESGPTGAEALVPGAAPSRYTLPTTQFTGLRQDTGLHYADQSATAPEPAHWPLVVMLGLTQTATACLVTAAVLPHHPMEWRLGGAILLVLGIVASTLHLGQPLKAWRAFLGWRKSWLSREILAFGAAAPAAILAVIAPAPWTAAACAVAAAAALASVWCSIMVYADTRRALWTLPLTSLSMGGTIFTTAAVALAWTTGYPAFAVLSILLLAGRTIAVSRFTHHWRFEEIGIHPHAKTARLLYGPLTAWWHLRLLAAAAGAILLIPHPELAFAAVVVAELAERVLFFRAVVAWRMPGNSSR